MAFNGNRKRNIIMVRPEYQRRIGFFTGLMAVMSILIGVGSFMLLPLLAGAFSTQRTYIPTNLLDMLMLSFPWLVVGIGLVFAFAVFAGIYYSHRIAGPLHKIEGILKEKLDGNMVEMIRLRPKDNLHELSNLINGLLEIMAHTEIAAQQLVEHLDPILALCDKKAEEPIHMSVEQQAQLIDLCHALRASLKG